MSAVPQDKINKLQLAVLHDLVPYEPATQHVFHGGMYCRIVFRHADVTVIGKVHKKEHFYMIVSGTVLVTTDDQVEEITGPRLLKCKPGTQRAVYSVTDAITATFHVADAKTVEDAEDELVEPAPMSMFGPGNKYKELT